MLMRRGGAGVGTETMKHDNNDKDFFSTHHGDKRNMEKSVSGGVSTDKVSHNSYVTTSARSISVFGSNSNIYNNDLKGKENSGHNGIRNHDNNSNNNMKNKNSDNTNNNNNTNKINNNDNNNDNKNNNSNNNNNNNNNIINKNDPYNSNRTSTDSTDNVSIQQKILQHVHSQLQLRSPRSVPQKNVQGFFPPRISTETEENEILSKENDGGNSSKSRIDNNETSAKNSLGEIISNKSNKSKEDSYNHDNSSDDDDYNDNNNENDRNFNFGNNSIQQSSKNIPESFERSSFSTSKTTAFDNTTSMSKEGALIIPGSSSGSNKGIYMFH